MWQTLGCVTEGGSLNLPKPRFPLMFNEGTKPFLLALFWGAVIRPKNALTLIRGWSVTATVLFREN